MGFMESRFEVTLNLGERIPAKELLLLLEYIDHLGSLNQASEKAGLSYRYSWGLLNRAEKALDKTLVVRQTGGASGGGTCLTNEGKRLLGHLRTLQREVQSQIDTLLAENSNNPDKTLMLASTMEPVVTGLLDVLEQAYFLDTGITVRHIAAGSGQAIAMAMSGRVDMILTHAPELEDKFVREGWALRRLPVMSNNYVFVGPENDPAGIGDANDVKDVLQRIAQSASPFISRGDRSGTHLFEVSLWQETGINPEGKAWYHVSRNVLGSFGALGLAEEHNGYTIVDKASYVSARQTLHILFDDDPILRNVFSVLTINRAKAVVNQEAADQFADWLQSPRAARIIKEFGIREYKTTLFTPIKDD
jgi:tungstate transport system substrate-binding protein